MPGTTSRAEAEGVRQSLLDSQVKTFRGLSRVCSASRVRYSCHNSPMLESAVLREHRNRLSLFLPRFSVPFFENSADSYRLRRLRIDFQWTFRPLRPKHTIWHILARIEASLEKRNESFRICSIPIYLSRKRILRARCSVGPFFHGSPKGNRLQCSVFKREHVLP